MREPYCAQQFEGSSYQPMPPLQPFPDEIKAFKSLDLTFLSLEAPWPPPILRYIYRYMNNYDLYQTSKSNARLLSMLVSMLGSHAGLPDTAEVIGRVIERCKLLIDTSAWEWVDQGLLVLRDGELRKSPQFQELWDAKVSQLGGAVVGLADGLRERNCNNGDLDLVATCDFIIATAERVEANGTLKKKYKSPYPKDRARSAKRSQPHAQAGDERDKTQRSEPDVVVNRGRQAGGETGSLPPSIVNSDAKDVVVDQGNPSLGAVPNYVRSKTELRRVDQPETRPEFPSNSHSLPTLCEGSEVDEGMAYVAQEALSLMKSQDEYRSQSTQFPREEASIGLASGSSNSSTPQDDPKGICYLVDKPHSNTSHETPAIKQTSIAYLLNETAYPSQSTPTKATPSAPPTAHPHPRCSVSVTASEKSPTKRWVASTGQKSSMPTSSSAPPEASVSRASNCEQLNLSSQAAAQRLLAIGKILIPQSNCPDLWMVLPLNLLLSQDVLDFYAWYAQYTRTCDVSVLAFELLEVTLQSDRCIVVSQGNPNAFGALKEHILKWFIGLERDPGLTTFGVLITTPPQHVAGERVAGMSRPEQGRPLAPGPITRGTRSPMPSRGKHRPPRSSNACPVTQHIPSMTIVSNSGWEPLHRTSYVQPLTSRVAPAFQVQQVPTLPGSLVRRLGRRAASTIPLAIRIQENRHGKYSRRYDQTVLTPETTSLDFFTWFAHRQGCAIPAELTFTFKDALPPRSCTIFQGNEEIFDYMKMDINRQSDLATALMPDLFEFVILVSVPE